MYTIRLHLGQGKNHGHFQIRECLANNKQGDVVGYVDGTKNSLLMTDCFLYNNINISEKIHSGRYPKKRPCAYIVCADYSITELREKTAVEICINPRKCPNWTFEKMNINNTNFENLISVSDKIYQL